MNHSFIRSIAVSGIALLGLAGCVTAAPPAPSVTPVVVQTPATAPAVVLTPRAY